jgi:hypothetical protein
MVKGVTVRYVKVLVTMVIDVRVTVPVRIDVVVTGLLPKNCIHSNQLHLSKLARLIQSLTTLQKAVAEGSELAGTTTLLHITDRFGSVNFRIRN